MDNYLVRFQVLKAASMKMAVFRVVAPYRSSPTLQELAALTIEATTSETSVDFYQLTQRYNPQNSNLKLILF
jgi:hypothetical protein